MPNKPPLTFEQLQSLMKMFSDNAKTYIQLSGLALGLTVTFTQSILGDKNGAAPSRWMIAMWACFLAAIVAGAFYQYLAVKYVERKFDPQYLGIWEWLAPGSVYAIMLAAFYGGAGIFTIYAIVRLR